jgi:hypothetical protein
MSRCSSLGARRAHCGNTAVGSPEGQARTCVGK